MRLLDILLGGVSESPVGPVPTPPQTTDIAMTNTPATMPQRNALMAGKPTSSGNIVRTPGAVAYHTIGGKNG